MWYNMEISLLWVTQRNLHRMAQISAMVEALKRGDLLPPIVLHKCDDDEIQVNDGHHRLVAIWLSGRTVLEKNEYLIYHRETSRLRCGNIHILLQLPPSSSKQLL